ncbi:tonB-system energizer ExbB [Microbulbifer sp. VAAF005]|uniref:tonB-system energizer ExbB n=1 Tax=Microbulbifer sp. VAAF005 TaxID=3034230 RepID=UPI0024AE161F|nr:tonB-system energizer ExbB [Microbulbifer sp. VAAF005]WHI47740.1 tonB-system energizer ExbB [Microbulbifer sp. VAAF005]
MKIWTVILLCLLGSTLGPLPALAQENNSNSSEQSNTEIVLGGDVETSVGLQENQDNSTSTATSNVGDTAFSAHDLSPMGMYHAADIVVKSVMIGLLLASVLTWAIWLFKTVQLVITRRKAKQLLATLIQSNTFANAESKLSGQTGGALLLVEASRHELELSSGGPVSDDGLKERVLARLERVQASLATDMNRGTGILATIGSVAPFVGLFGTVWGIMNSFIGIAKTQTTNLAVVAPGIAEALLATAIGLVAAIPAVVIYNYFSRAIGNYRAVLADNVTALMVLISRDLDRHHPNARPLAELVSANKMRAVPQVQGVN